MLCKVTHWARCVSANTGPHQLCRSDWEMGTAISYKKSSLMPGLIHCRSISKVTSLLAALCMLVLSYSFLTLVSCRFMASFRITSNPPSLLLKSTIFPSLTSRRSRASVMRAVPSTVSVGGVKQNKKEVPLSYRFIGSRRVNNRNS